MEANPPMELHLDSLHKTDNTQPIYQGIDLPQAYTGKGVVVGIADVGFDFTHPMFYDQDGHNRIKQVWDIYTGMGTGYKNIGSLLTTEDEINLKKGSSDSQSEYHGTHVSGIAAGSPVMNGKYHGVAYEADIVLSMMYLEGAAEESYQKMITDINNSIKAETADPIWQQALKNNITITDAMSVLAIKHIMDYAAAHGQPCVVNCSFGRQMRLYDDYTLMNELFTELTGPGRIIVCSAGNYGDTDIYRVKQQDETLDTKLWFWAVKSMTPSITMRADKPFTLTLQPDVANCPSITVSSEDFPLKGSGENYEKYIDINSAENQYGISKGNRILMPDGDYAYNLTIVLPDRQLNRYSTPSVGFRLEGEGAVQIMGEFTKAGFTQFSTRPVSCPYTIQTPSLLDDAISVGAMSYRQEYTNLNRLTHTPDNLREDSYNRNSYNQIVSWSAVGPTLSGIAKPDIAASGYNVISAYNSLMDQDKYTQQDGTYHKRIMDTFKYGDKDYYMLVESGTSMSAPVITGTIALWLQADPTLTPARIKEVFSRTATHPDATLTYPNNIYGNGAIDAYKGLYDILGIADKIEGFSSHQPEGASISLSSKTLILGGISEATVKIYTISGTLVQTTTTTDGTIDLSSLSAGVYAVQINTADPSTTGSTLIRIPL